MRSTTTATTRTQADTSNEPGEQSLSTESLWRRTQDSWHYGASQVFLDRKNSNEFQFRSSKGINPWTEWQISLHRDTTLAYASVNTNLQLVVCGAHVYLIDGQTLTFSSDLVTWTTVTGTPTYTATSICSDGFTVYVSYGTAGLYSTTEGAMAATQYVTSPLASNSVVRFVMGRLIVSVGPAIYNIITSGALPPALFTSNITGFVWSDFTSGLAVIYASGASGDKSTVYRIGITTDGTTLDAPVVAGQLPYGEIVQALYGYVGGTLAIGTNLGWRFAEQASTAGDLSIGSLVLQPGGVGCFSGYNHFIWGGYTNYDNVSTGLFRMDPTVFTADLVPAWASDLMATTHGLATSTQGTVTSVAHVTGYPTFAVAGVGIFTRAPSYVTSGTVDSGLITYGLADNKVAVFVDLTYTLPGGSINTSVSLNGGTFTPIGGVSAGTSAELATPQTLSQSIELRETLVAGPSNGTSPVLTRHTLRSVPAPPIPTDWQVVIQLRERCRQGDVEFSMVPSVEYAYLNGLCFTKQICTLQVGNMGPYAVTIESIDWLPEQVAHLSGELNGVMVLTARTVV